MSEMEELPASAENALEVRTVRYTDEANGRGVFARQAIARGTLVELAHCIRISKEQHDVHCVHTELNNYTFKCPNGDYFLALGLGSLFNHHDPPNVDYRVDGINQIIRYYAASNIEKDEELCIYYGPRLWFDKATENLGEAQNPSANLPFEEE